jgi:prepilin-type N-terminal cleavage/methylation domain-containing protein
MNRRRGFGLIEVLIVVAIMLILMALILPRYLGGKDALTGKKHSSPRERAQQVQGISYLGQIAQAIAMYKMDHDDQPPQSLSELKRYGVTPEMLIEPTSHKPYGYDPQTGRLVNPY